MHDVLYIRKSCVLVMLASDQAARCIQHVQSDTGSVDHNAAYTYISAAGAAARGQLPGSCWQPLYRIYCRARWARDFCHLPRSLHVCHLEVRQTDSVVLRIHSDTFSAGGHFEVTE